ncbi:MAG: putative colanic acid biosynthesis acetyltransferase [Tannerella sp.]|nr:putative colanic acid biosynthesis acetyltransferase [Tannerella sp.]
MIDLSKYQNPSGRRHRFIRYIWSAVWFVFARPLPRSAGSGWKRFLLKLFGAKIHRTAVVYSSAKIYYPPNLEMGVCSCLAPGVECYNVAPVIIGANVTVSQNACLYTASHDISDRLFPLTTAPVTIKDRSWIAAGAFIGMGVTVGEGAVVGARSAVFKDVPPWTVVGGNPAKVIKRRELKN